MAKTKKGSAKTVGRVPEVRKVTQRKRVMVMTGTGRKYMRDA